MLAPSLHQFVRTLIVAVAGLVLAGCASSTTPRLDARFGDAVRQVRALQTIDQSASSNPDPVAGIDGPAARNTVDRYRESFKTPPATSSATFSVHSVGQ